MGIDKFFAKYGKPKFAFKLIESELHDAKHALKKDKLPANRDIFAPGLLDTEFLDIYYSSVDGTFPIELAEAAIKIADLASAHDYDLTEYIQIEQRRCDIENAVKQPETAKIIIRYAK